MFFCRILLFRLIPGAFPLFRSCVLGRALWIFALQPRLLPALNFPLSSLVYLCRGTAWYPPGLASTRVSRARVMAT